VRADNSEHDEIFPEEHIGCAEEALGPLDKCLQKRVDRRIESADSILDRAHAVVEKNVRVTTSADRKLASKYLVKSDPRVKVALGTRDFDSASAQTGKLPLYLDSNHWFALVRLTAWV
jgi:hypothetical protein